MDSNLVVHRPKAELSTAENILRLLRPDPSFTDLEAQVLDIALVLHAEHGGGNNSSFTTHVISTTGTDTYSTVAGSLGSLKGPRHGGANLKVQQMIADLKANVTNTESDDQVRDYLSKVLNKEAFDKRGLIYGMGHAIYTISDPRAEIFHSYVEELAKYEGLEEEFALHERVARLAPELIAERRKMYKGVCVNVDFYSGFAYSMLGLPKELYTPLFAMARIVGWSAHRIEELANNGKIIRPAYKSIAPENTYIPMDER
jgi:citrate synthase